MSYVQPDPTNFEATWVDAPAYAQPDSANFSASWEPATPPIPLSGFQVTMFGEVNRRIVHRIGSMRATRFGTIYVPVPRVTPIRGFKTTRFGMVGRMPHYNPIRENWIRPLRGFKATKFGGD